VSEIDTAGVQLLMLAKQAALARNSELRLTGHSPAVLEVFELLNVAAYFSDPLVMASRVDASDERVSNAASSRKSHGY
jgi:anti-anti-sigma regulatory factor